MKHLTLTLYNSYDKNRVHDIHLRSIARAAPVCYAAGFNLCLVGFPFKDPRAEVVGNTTIGEGGRFLEILASRQEFFCSEDFSLPQELIVTTSKPDEGKAVALDTLADMIRRGMDANFVVGLGRKGLPTPIRKKGRYHLDITGRGIPFETCTAIGYIPAAVSARLL
ncbi:MAG: DUF531 family protein [Candidatus Methanofastidiosa archaeon]|nr:DUF531 domain-containing protein [Candidatus Methanofastidiosa archaeon]MDD4281187.1 DUF531 family protein [Candidatus Methanofastidiosa archaeon]